VVLFFLIFQKVDKKLSLFKCRKITTGMFACPVYVRLCQRTYLHFFKLPAILANNGVDKWSHTFQFYKILMKTYDILKHKNCKTIFTCIYIELLKELIFTNNSKSLPTMESTSGIILPNILKMRPKI
jgi:hypothetical protein